MICKSLAELLSGPRTTGPSRVYHFSLSFRELFLSVIGTDSLRLHVKRFYIECLPFDAATSLLEIHSKEINTGTKILGARRNQDGIFVNDITQSKVLQQVGICWEMLSGIQGCKE